MTPEEVVRAELGAWEKLDVDAIISCFAPEAVWENVASGAVRSGHAAIREVTEGYMAHTKSFRAEILNIATSGNVVLTERIDHVDYDGRVVDLRIMGAFEVAEGKVRAWRDYFDMGGLSG
jgi:limonene-1,2-epoxide hydrolase